MTKLLEHNVLIIPDVHGRVFWKRAIEQYMSDIESGNIEVVFLGDYLDPYPDEIEDEIAYGVIGSLKQLKETFIPLAKKYPNNVHLLLGNHDLQYYSYEFAKYLPRCRYSHTHEDKIIKVFEDDKDLFHLAWDCYVGDVLYLFSHAGVLKSWVDYFFKDNKIKRPNADFLNNIIENSMNDISALSSVGPCRGGMFRIPGSPVWADAEEHLWGWKYEEYPNRVRQEVYKDKIYQIFGHTRTLPSGNNLYDNRDSLDKYYIGEHWAMLDARRCFVMDINGNIKEFEGNE